MKAAPISPPLVSRRSLFATLAVALPAAATLPGLVPGGASASEPPAPAPAFETHTLESVVRGDGRFFYLSGLFDRPDTAPLLTARPATLLAPVAGAWTQNIPDSAALRAAFVASHWVPGARWDSAALLAAGAAPVLVPGVPGPALFHGPGVGPFSRYAMDADGNTSPVLDVIPCADGVVVALALPLVPIRP